MDLLLSSFVSHFFLLTAQSVIRSSTMHGFPTFVNRNSSIFSVVTVLIAEALLVLFFVSSAV